MDLMWLLIGFFLFMLVILTVFISSMLHALFRQLPPIVHVVAIVFLSVAYERLLLDYNLIWIITILVTVSYLLPLLIAKLYYKGERIERERLK